MNDTKITMKSLARQKADVRAKIIYSFEIWKTFGMFCVFYEK